MVNEKEELIDLKDELFNTFSKYEQQIEEKEIKFSFEQVNVLPYYVVTNVTVFNKIFDIIFREFLKYTPKQSEIKVHIEYTEKKDN